MVPQAAGVVRGRFKGAPQRVHFRHRRDLSGIAEIIFVDASRKGRAGSRFDGYNPRIALSGKLILHKRRDQSAQIRAASRAAYYNIRIFIQQLHCLFCFQPDNRLVEQHLIENRTQHVTISVAGDSPLYGLGNGASQAAAVLRIFGQDFSPRFRPIRRRGEYIGAEGFHNVLSERFLVIRNFYHIHFQIQTKVGARFGQGSSPLSRSGFRGNPFQPLLFRVISLGHSGVQLVAAGSIVSFKFIIDLRRRIQRFFQIISPA